MVKVVKINKLFKVILSNESNSDNTDILILISSVDNKSCMIEKYYGNFKILFEALVFISINFFFEYSKFYLT